jgi:glycosyltransferase involved in cell wall biosynthesis
MFLKDVFGDVPLAMNLEWYFQVPEQCYIPRQLRHVRSELFFSQIRLKNSAALQDFAAADAVCTATNFQREQFPKSLQKSMKVIHEGIDTDFFKPMELGSIKLAGGALKLSQTSEIVTYASRGFEEVRGFPEFLEAVYYLQKMRPTAHVVFAGADAAPYGGLNSLPSTGSWKSEILNKFDFDLDRLHFVGTLNLEDYRTLLRCSSAHVYLTWPFVTSWSLLEAMACEALIVGSATGPVEEFVKDRENGLLVNMHDPYGLAKALADILSKPRKHYSELRKNARNLILEKYSLRDCLNVKFLWLNALMSKAS